MRDLFGVEISDEPPPKTKPQAKGWAAPPGTGPKGETCRSCKHSYYHEMSKRYWKCDLVEPTGGLGTDIRLKWAACLYWEKKET